jgi:transcriptional regulator with XRE-family HTH domain
MGRPPPQPSDLAAAELVLSAKVNRKELGRMLRSVREASGVTQVELARRLGIPYTSISRLEAGAREGMITTVNRYLQALGWELTLLAKKKT